MRRCMILVFLGLFASALFTGCIPMWGKASGNRYECMNSSNSDRSEFARYDLHSGI